MLDKGKRRENGITWTGLWQEAAGFDGRQNRKDSL